VLCPGGVIVRTFDIWLRSRHYESCSYSVPQALVWHPSDGNCSDAVQLGR